MSTAPQNDDDWTPDALKLRIGNYIARIVGFNSGWGIHGRGKRPDGFYGHFFRFDANRMTRMVLACEHLIRCMIIWMAVRAYRDTDIQPANYRLPSGGARGPRAPEAPMDAMFALRALPLYEPKLPPFLISMPQPTKHAALSAFYANGSSREQNENVSGAKPARLRATGSSKRRKLRNDQILDCNHLVERSHRLSKLFDEIDSRARRLAARWAGYLTNPGTDDSVEHPTSDRVGATSPSETRGIAGEQKKPTQTTSPSSQEYSPERDPSRSPGLGPGRSGRSNQIKLNPLKTYWPPPDLFTEAPDDEAEDLRELHDVARRATEAFPSLCG